MSCKSDSDSVPFPPDNKIPQHKYSHVTFLFENTDKHAAYLHSVRCLVQANMLLSILLINLILRLTFAGADATSSTPKLGLEDLEKLVDKLESRLRDMETRMQNEQDEKEMLVLRLEKTEAKIKEMASKLESKEKDVESKLEDLEDKIKQEKDDNALAQPTPRDLPIVFISAWRQDWVTSPQTVTYESFLFNFNNADKPGGGDGELDLDSGVFTCFTPGYYSVSFSAYAVVGPDDANPRLYLYKNTNIRIDESMWYFWAKDGAVNDRIGVTGSRVAVSKPHL